MLRKEDAIRTQKRVKGKNRYYLHVFNCTGCGNELFIQGQSLHRHSGKCMRCGHLGVPYMFIYNELLNHKRRDTEVKITFEEFLDLIKKPECHYCGVPLQYKEHSKVWNKNNSRAHQLDRKNNDIGYEKNNLVPCCWECNRLKSNRFTYEEFIQLSPILKKIQNDKIINEKIK